MKRPLTNRFFRLLTIALVIEVLFFFGFLFIGFPSTLTNEIFKLETSVNNRTAELKHSLQKFRLNVDNSVTAITALLSENIDLAAEWREIDSLPLLVTLLEQSEATGMFIIYGDLSDPGSGREMLYLRDMKPEKNDNTYEDIKIMRGRRDLTKTFGIPNASVWQSTLNLTEIGSDFYREALTAVRDNGVRPWNYGHFSGMFRMSENDYLMMTYTVPIVAADGTVLGVFGAELAAAQLKSMLPVRDIPFATGIYLFTALPTPEVDPAGMMISGGYGDILKYAESPLTLIPLPLQGRELQNLKVGDITLVGVAREVSLYDAGDYFFPENNWQLICLVDSANFYAAGNQTRTTVSIWIIVIILVNVLGMLIMGRQMRHAALDFDELMASFADQLGGIEKTGPEGEKLDRVSARDHAAALFGEFISRCQTLTEAEKNIFRLYTEGKEPQEAADITFTTLNTVKMHNKHIYEKLQISSRYELMLYIDLLRKTKMLEEIL